MTVDDVRALELLVKESIQSGKLAATAQALEGVVSKLSNDRNPDTAQSRAQILCELSSFYQTSSMMDRAAKAAEAAATLAREVDAKPVLRRALNAFAGALINLGDLTRATELLDEALGLARELRDSVAEAAVLANAAVIQINGGLHGDALATAAKVIDLFEQNRASPVLHFLAVSTYGNVAAAATYMDDPQLGEEAVASGLSLIETTSTGRDKSAFELGSEVMLNYHALRLLIARMAIGDARLRANKLRALASISADPRNAIYADLAEGLCEVHEGRHDIGLTRLADAINAAKVHATVYPEALRAIAKAYEVANRPLEALGQLNQLLGHLQNQQSGALRKRLAGIETRFLQSKPPEQVTVLEKQQAELGRAAAERALWELQREEMERLAIAAELRDDSTGEHSYRVGKLASLLARELNLPREQLRGIELAARLHDIGKISIPDSILLKPGRFNDTERKVMQSHTTIGADLLSQSKNPEMEIAQLVARYHHEWWDGTGYPDGLAGEDIPLVARISALADVFDALTHKRPYKEAIPFEESMAIIGSLRGTQFDPDLTDRFFELMYRLNAAYGDGLEALLAEEASKSAFLKARASINATVAAHSLGRIGALTSLSNTSRLRALSADASPAPDTKH